MTAMEEGLEVAPRRSSDVANPSLRARNLGVLLTPATRTKAIHPFSWQVAFHRMSAIQSYLSNIRLSVIGYLRCSARFPRRNRHLASPVPRFITYGAPPQKSIPDIRHTSYGPQATRKSWRSREIERSPSASAGLRLPKLAPRPIAFLDERGAQLPLSTNDGVHPRLRIVIGREPS